MKRILTFLVATSMVFGATAMASAAEVKLNGQFHTLLGIQDNVDSRLDKDGSEDNFFARSRFRGKVTAKANEYISGTWEFQVGNWDWGSNAQMDSNMSDFKTRLAYLTFNVPKSSATINMGVQKIALPSATFGNPIFDARVAGIQAGGKIAEAFNLSGFYARPYNNTAGEKSHNSADVFGVIAEIDAGAASISPYIVYGRIGHDSGFSNAPWLEGIDSDRNTHIYAGGAAVEVSPTEALSLKLDAMYGNAKNDDRHVADGYETDGYMVAVAVDYEMPFGTPGIFGWYSSGANKKGEGVLPVIGIDGGFTPVNLAYPGATSLGNDGIMGKTAVGTYGIGFAIADISCVEKLSHEFRIAYIAGTNNKRFNTNVLIDSELSFKGMNRKDSFIEIDFDSRYDIVENFAAVLQLAYIIPSFDQKDSAGNKYVSGGGDNAFNSQLYFLYNF